MSTRPTYLQLDPRRREYKEQEEKLLRNNGQMLPNFMKNSTQIPRAQQTPSRINTKKNTLRHIIIKQLKIKDKKNIESIKKKRDILVKREQ